MPEQNIPMNMQQRKDRVREMLYGEHARIAFGTGFLRGCNGSNAQKSFEDIYPTFGTMECIQVSERHKSVKKMKGKA